MKKIVTIQDISCFGKCSITVALPIISAMGVETAIIPTAVLSTHTMFKNFTCKDLDDQIVPITDHWKNEGISFDGIYTGYLASSQQIKTVMGVIEKMRGGDTLVVVDPAMADNGKLYPAFDDEFPKSMAKLCGVADIILPNITEACFMTGTQYKTEYDREYIDNLLKKLSALGAKRIVLKGVNLDGKFGVLCHDCQSGETQSYYHEKLSQSFHGTGDVFASAFVGAYVRGMSMLDSVKLAADFTVESIKKTLECDEPKWYGVDFEKAVGLLVKRLENI